MAELSFSEGYGRDVRDQIPIYNSKNDVRMDEIKLSSKSSKASISALFDKLTEYPFPVGVMLPDSLNQHLF
jgi:hypothetical protein